MERFYKQIITQHFEQHDQMLFMAGPRQVGKTTIAKELKQLYDNYCYLNFDIEADREVIIQGENAILKKLNYHTMHTKTPLLVLDEFHKYKHWKNFLKGFYDAYKSKINILVTGSAKLDIYQKGGDSLMGRYLLYRVHPLTVGELLQKPLSEKLITAPQKIELESIEELLNFGGFPDPFLKKNKRFAMQWRQLRRQQLFREDIRSLKQVQDMAHIEMLATLLRNQSGAQLNYSTLAKSIKVSVDTVTRWINILEEFFYCFKLQPWHKNVKRSLVKEPKLYLWDWAEVKDRGAKIETMIACHLHKAVHFWNDYGLGEFSLHYLRDKEKREVDFLVVRDDQPWFLVEAKSSENGSINKNLYYYQELLNVPHAFQLASNKEFVNKDCFSYTDPVIAPLVTFLSQLV